MEATLKTVIIPTNCVKTSLIELAQINVVNKKQQFTSAQKQFDILGGGMNGDDRVRTKFFRSQDRTTEERRDDSWAEYQLAIAVLELAEKTTGMQHSL